MKKRKILLLSSALLLLTISAFIAFTHKDAPPYGACPVGHHTDHLTPILYGLPNERGWELAREGKYYLGGCVVGEEKWYCQQHQIKF